MTHYVFESYSYIFVVAKLVLSDCTVCDYTVESDMSDHEPRRMTTDVQASRQEAQACKDSYT